MAGTSVAVGGEVENITANQTRNEFGTNERGNNISYHYGDGIDAAAASDDDARRRAVVIVTILIMVLMAGYGSVMILDEHALGNEHNVYAYRHTIPPPPPSHLSESHQAVPLSYLHRYMYRGNPTIFESLRP